MPNLVSIKGEYNVNLVSLVKRRWCYGVRLLTCRKHKLWTHASTFHSLIIGESKPHSFSCRFSEEFSYVQQNLWRIPPIWKNLDPPLLIPVWLRFICYSLYLNDCQAIHSNAWDIAVTFFSKFCNQLQLTHFVLHFVVCILDTNWKLFKISQTMLILGTRAAQ